MYRLPLRLYDCMHVNYGHTRESGGGGCGGCPTRRSEFTCVTISAAVRRPVHCDVRRVGSWPGIGRGRLAAWVGMRGSTHSQANAPRGPRATAMVILSAFV